MSIAIIKGIPRVKRDNLYYRPVFKEIDYF